MKKNFQKAYLNYLQSQEDSMSASKSAICDVVSKNTKGFEDLTKYRIVVSIVGGATDVISQIKTDGENCVVFRVVGDEAWHQLSEITDVVELYQLALILTTFK